MIHVKNGYPRRELNESGYTETTVYYSTEEADIEAKYNELLSIGFSRLNRTTENGIYELEAISTYNTDAEFSNKPDTSFGSFTASLSAVELNMPLEQHPKYRAKWNHFFFAKNPGTVPSWWENSTNEIIPSADNGKYKWGTSASECPEGWVCLRSPTMPGVQGYSIPSFVFSETARFRSFQEAFDRVRGRMGAVIAPYTPIAIEQDRDWRCNDARVQWSGEHWLATFSYTLSGQGGWNSELYK